MIRFTKKITDSSLKDFIISTIGISLLGLTINLLSWKYKLISSGLPGYALSFNYATGVSTGTFLLISNTIILLMSFLVAGRTAGIKGVYGYVLLSLFIDFSKSFLHLTQTPINSFLINSLLISIQGFLASIFIAFVIHHNYSFGSYSSIIPIVDKFKKISPPIQFLFFDCFLILITLLSSGIKNATYLTFNVIIFFVTFRYSLLLLKKQSTNQKPNTRY